MKKYWPYIRKNWYCFLLAPVFMTLEACGEFILPFINANIIDRGAANGDVPFILQNGLWMVLIALSMLITGVPIERIDRGFLRRNIAMVLQDAHLFTGTVRENIRYGRLDATDDEVVEAAKAASADGFIRQLENGYDTLLTGDGANLSQGQRQLLNIARAAISRASILILDEATSSVDTRTEKYIERGMDALMQNRTTFVIAHRLSTVRASNAIMVLEKGRIIERGTHEELLAVGGRYANLYNEIVELD